MLRGGFGVCTYGGEVILILLWFLLLTVVVCMCFRFVLSVVYGVWICGEVCVGECGCFLSLGLPCVVMWCSGYVGHCKFGHICGACSFMSSMRVSSCWCLLCT